MTTKTIKPGDFIFQEETHFSKTIAAKNIRRALWSCYEQASLLPKRVNSSHRSKARIVLDYLYKEIQNDEALATSLEMMIQDARRSY